MKLAKLFKLTAFAWFFIFAVQARASKVEILTGAYSFSAKTENAKGSLSNLGAYRLNISEKFADHFSVGLGFTLLMEKVIGGDMGFGFDLGVSYFFMSRPSSMKFRDLNFAFETKEIWRPYVGLSFNQRQFQSVRTNYAGFGIAAGVERSLTLPFDLKAEIRYCQLTGSATASATEMTLAAGIVYKF